jgi:hypothetical protein
MRFAFLPIFLLASVYYAIAAPVDSDNGMENKLMSRTNSNGNFYLYSCKSCRCDAAYVYTDFTGSTGCLNVGSQQSIGLTATSAGIGPISTTCSVYFEENCQGSHQSVGVHYRDSWGCTEGQQDIKSVMCFYQTGPCTCSNKLSNKRNRLDRALKRASRLIVSSLVSS